MIGLEEHDIVRRALAGIPEPQVVGVHPWAADDQLVHLRCPLAPEYEVCWDGYTHANVVFLLYEQHVRTKHSERP